MDTKWLQVTQVSQIESSFLSFGPSLNASIHQLGLPEGSAFGKTDKISYWSELGDSEIGPLK